MSNTKLASSRVSPASARARRVPAGGCEEGKVQRLLSVIQCYSMLPTDHQQKSGQELVSK